ncbi:hypothetical protein ACHAXR_011402 [Thalassiosira sp. AJA248-18]
MGGSCGDSSPPLRIVLGAFNDSSMLPLAQDKGSASPSTIPMMESSSPATYILGTSYFASPRLGTSKSSTSGRSVLRLNKDGRVPMEDRKGPLDHFKPKSLVLSTFRVTAINISTTLSTFFSDQLNNEQRIGSMEESGEITQREADKMNEEWENREWELRKDALPTKIGCALLRFHACTAMMRFYEFIMARYVLRVDGDSGRGVFPAILDGHNNAATASTQAVTIMDKLTRDPFQASLRTSQLLHNQEHSPGKVISSNGTETSTSVELTKRMFSTCIWANIIPFLAELSVQQGVLIYGYGLYYMAKKKKRQRKGGGSNDEIKEEDAKPVPAQCKEDDTTDKQAEIDDDAISESAYALSLMFRSSRLTIARSMSWVAASAGGAMGSVVYPGWGTVFGIQIGDTVVGALID